LKARFTNYLSLVLVAAGLILSIGCASIYKGHSDSLRLKIIDAKTGDPVPGVSAIWREDLDDLLTGHYQTGPTNLASSNAEGIILIPEVHKKMAGRFILSCPGYHTTYGLYSEGELKVSGEIQPAPIPQDTFTLDDAQTIGLSDDSFLIRMQK